MADSAQFISVLTPCTATGTIRVVLQTFDASTDATITTDVSVTNTDTVEAVAVKILNALNVELAAENADYRGYPVNSIAEPEATFQCNRTGHIVSIWSESQFSLTVSHPGSVTGVTWKVGNPLFLSLAEMASVGTIFRQTYLGVGGVALSNTEKQDLVYAACVEIVEFLSNPIVIRTYVHEEIGFWTESIYLRKTPITTWDAPLIRPAAVPTGLVTSDFQDVRTPYTVSKKSGEVHFRKAQNILFSYEPFDYHNEIRMSYRAGYGTIPDVIKHTAVKLTKLYERASTGFKMLAGGTSKIEFENSVSEAKTDLLQVLDSFKLPPEM